MEQVSRRRYTVGNVVVGIVRFREEKANSVCNPCQTMSGIGAVTFLRRQMISLIVRRSGVQKASFRCAGAECPNATEFFRREGVAAYGFSNHRLATNSKLGVFFHYRQGSLFFRLPDVSEVFWPQAFAALYRTFCGHRPRNGFRASGENQEFLLVLKATGHLPENVFVFLLMQVQSLLPSGFCRILSSASCS